MRFKTREEAQEHCNDGQIVIKSAGYLNPWTVMDIPKVGDEVSMTFNGDCYPCGTIARISPTLKVITTTDGKKFYRKGDDSGCWKYSGTFSLTPGHISRLNPEF